MKHSLLRLISSFYILLISALMIVISAYAWMIISDSPAAGGIGFGIAGLDQWKIPEVVEPETYDYMDEIRWTADDVAADTEHQIFQLDEYGTYIIDSAEKFVAMMEYINGNKALQGNVSMRLVTNISLEDHQMAPIITEGDDGTITETPVYWNAADWQSVKISGYTGTACITLDADASVNESEEFSTLYLKGLSKPLFSGGFAGNSGIMIYNITIFDSKMMSNTDQGSGAFIECVDSMPVITLQNCHLLNSSIDVGRTDGKYSRVGGLIGWTAGYNNPNDGPVKTFVTIDGCSVIGCQLEGTSVGGIHGHAGANAWTFTTISNCTVENNRLISHDDGAWRVGELIGTANVGEVTIIDSSADRNALLQINKTPPTDHSHLFGRFVPSGSGKMAIVDMANATVDVYGALMQEIAYLFEYEEGQFVEHQTWNLHGSIALPNEFRFQGSHMDIVGYNDATLLLNSVATGYVWTGMENSSSGFNFGNYMDYTNNVKPDSVMNFTNIKIINNKTLKDCSTGANRSTSYMYAYAANVSYTDCVFDGGVVAYGNASFERCQFTETESNRYCLFLDNEYGRSEGKDYDVIDCTFYSTKQDDGSLAYGCLKVADDKNMGATLLLEDSRFFNDTAKPAVYINGATAVTTNGNNQFTSINGGILAKGNACTLNGGACLTTSEYAAAQKNEDKTLLNEYDMTEFGNNGGGSLKNSEQSVLNDSETEETTTTESVATESTAETEETATTESVVTESTAETEETATTESAVTESTAETEETTTTESVATESTAETEETTTTETVATESTAEAEENPTQTNDM